jgi:hypothetical protein
VQARIETEVAAAMSGSELMGQYVAAALLQPIDVQDKNYNRRKSTYLQETIYSAIQEATKAAVRKVIAEEAPAIEKQVAAELRANVKQIAGTLVGNVVEAAGTSYGVSVELRVPGR